MFSIIIKIICFSGGTFLFYWLADLFNRAYNPEQQMQFYNLAGFIAAGFLLGLLISPYTEKWALRLHRQILRSLQNFSPHALASGFIGLLMGFLFSLIVTLPFWLFLKDNGGLNLAMTIIGCVIFGYMGVLIFSRVSLWGGGVVSNIAYSKDAARPKVLDTSVIIDGRVKELLDSGFIEGKIIVPDIVLNELQGIADSAEATRRKRGRRGLKIVSQMKENEKIFLEVVDLPAPRAGEPAAVDARLVNYSKSIGGVLITNDFNLSKIAELRGVDVINLNTLSGSLRRTLLPGEIIEVSVIKYGKEHGQGIAYLEDGAMVVIEKGDKFIGETVSVEIKNIMQSVAGQLIFAMVSDQPADDTGDDYSDEEKDKQQ